MNLKLFAFFLLVIFLMNSCSQVNKVPEKIVEKDKMGAILFEIAMAEGYLENYQFRDTSVNRDSFLTSELDKVLAIHKVSQKEFLESYTFYKSNPEIFKALTDTIYNRAQRNPEKLYGKRSQQNVEPDKSK